jgi:hypothetical protein
LDNLINELKKTISAESQKKVLVNERFVKIKEDNPNSKLKSVTISNFDKNDKIFAFSLDISKYKQLSFYINRLHYNKGCDGVVVLKRDEKIYVMICELKSSRPKPKQFINQIKSSEAFIYYIFKALNIFGNSDFSIDNLNIIRILFDTTNPVKVQVRQYNQKPIKIHDNIYKFDCYEGDSSVFHINTFLDIINNN